MRKRRVRLTESDIKRIVRTSVRLVLSESVNGGMDVTPENIRSAIGHICPFKIVRYSDFYCVEFYDSYYKTFNECVYALEDAFGKDKIIGDSAINSIYVSLKK